MHFWLRRTCLNKKTKVVQGKKKGRQKWEEVEKKETVVVRLCWKRGKSSLALEVPWLQLSTCQRHTSSLFFFWTHDTRLLSLRFRFISRVMPYFRFFALYSSYMSSSSDVSWNSSNTLLTAIGLHELIKLRRTLKFLKYPRIPNQPYLYRQHKHVTWTTRPQNISMQFRIKIEDLIYCISARSQTHSKTGNEDLSVGLCV